MCHIIRETCIALWQALQPEYVKAPSSAEDWKVISREFEKVWNFPHCIGAINGKSTSASKLLLPQDLLTIITRVDTQSFFWLFAMPIIGLTLLTLEILVDIVMVVFFPTQNLARH